MYFAVICRDKPDSLQLRMDTRPEHVVFLNDLNDKGILKLAGPFANAEGKPYGSLVILEAGSKEEAEKIAAADPYTTAGLFAEVTVHQWNWVFNAPEQA